MADGAYASTGDHQVVHEILLEVLLVIGLNVLLDPGVRLYLRYGVPTFRIDGQDTLEKALAVCKSNEFVWEQFGNLRNVVAIGYT